MAYHEKGNYALMLTIQALSGEKFDYILETLMEHFYKLSLD